MWFPLKGRTAESIKPYFFLVNHINPRTRLKLVDITFSYSLFKHMVVVNLKHVRTNCIARNSGAPLKPFIVDSNIITITLGFTFFQIIRLIFVDSTEPLLKLFTEKKTFKNLKWSLNLY